MTKEARDKPGLPPASNKRRFTRPSSKNTPSGGHSQRPSHHKRTLSLEEIMSIFGAEVVATDAEAPCGTNA